MYHKFFGNNPVKKQKSWFGTPENDHAGKMISRYLTDDVPEIREKK
jgi:hypothetical protein